MEKITLKNRKGQKIVGLLERPKGEMKGTAVLQHGWGGTKESSTIQSVKTGFLQAGFQTFNFDTTNSFGESDGDFEKSTLGLHYEDLEDVVKWVQKQEWFLKPLALSGHSKGGYAVVRYVEDHLREVDFLISVAPVISGELSFEAANEFDPAAFNKWKEERIQVSEKHGNLMRKHWFQMEERLQHDLLPDASKVTIPTLLVVGTKDTSCPAKHIEKLFKVLAAEDKKIHLIEGAPHSYYEENELKDCTDAIYNWVKSRV